MELNLATMAHQPESMKTPKIITIDYPWLPIVYLLEPWLHFWMLGIVPFHLVFLFSLVLLSSSVPQLLSSSAPPLINSCTKQQATKRISQDNEIFIWKTSLMLFLTAAITFYSSDWKGWGRPTHILSEMLQDLQKFLQAKLVLANASLQKSKENSKTEKKAFNLFL